MFVKEFALDITVCVKRGTPTFKYTIFVILFGNKNSIFIILPTWAVFLAAGISYFFLQLAGFVICSLYFVTHNLIIKKYAVYPVPTCEFCQYMPNYPFADNLQRDIHLQISPVSYLSVGVVTNRIKKFSLLGAYPRLLGFL